MRSLSHAAKTRKLSESIRNAVIENQSESKKHKTVAKEVKNIIFKTMESYQEVFKDIKLSYDILSMW